MKLRLPLFLLGALTSLCSLSVWSTTALASDTEYVYTGAGANIHDASSWKYFNGTTWVNGYTNSGTWNSLNGWGNAGANNTMRFMEATAYNAATGATLGAVKNPNYTFAPLGLGGVTVDQGATGYSVAPGSTSSLRNIQLNAKAGGTSAVFDIKENFSLSANSSSTNGSNILLNCDVDMILSSATTVGGDYTGPASVFTMNGKMVGGAGKRIALSGGGTLSYTWTGATTAQTLSANWLVTGSSLLNLATNTTLANLNAALGSGAVTLNSGNLSVATGISGTLSQAFTVSGASALNAGAGLKFNNLTLNATTLTAGNGLNIDNATLNLTGGDSSVDGNVTFSGTSTINFVETVPSQLSSTGVLDLGTQVLTLNFGLGTQAGTYTLFSAASFVNVDFGDIAAKFIYVGLGARQQVDWSGSTATSLIASIEGETGELVWAGGSGSWGQGLTTDAIWESVHTLPDYHFQQYDNVTIGKAEDTALTTGTLTLVSDVEVGLMTVTGAGSYTLAATTNEKVIGIGSLVKEGTGTFRIENANTYSGGTTVKDGVLQVANSNALSTGDVTLEGGSLSLENTIANKLVFNGGSLNIANDMALGGAFSTTTAESARLSVEAGKTLSLTTAQVNALPLSLSGAGTTQLSVTSATTLTQNISVASGATFRATNSAAGGTMFALNGALSGDGTLALVSTYATTASDSAVRFSVAVNNSAFNGTLSLQGTWDFSKFSPTSGAYHDVMFANYQAFGAGTVRVQNMGFFMNSANSAANKVAATIELVGENYLNGGSNQSYYFNGLAGSGSMTTWLGGATSFAYWLGDLTQFTGTLSSSSVTFTYTFGNGATATLANGKLFGDGATLTGRHASNRTGYIVNYTNDLELNATISGKATLTKQGSNVVTMAQANTYDGQTTISGGTLKVSNAQALGTGAVAVNTGATLEVAAGGTSIGNGITNSGTVKVASGSTLNLTTYTGNANSKLIVGDNATLQGTGSALGSTLLTVSTGVIKNVGTLATAQTTEFQKAATAGGTLSVQNSVLSGANASFNVQTMALEASVLNLSGTTTAEVSSSNMVRSAFGDLTGTTALFSGDAASSLTMTGTLNLVFGADFFDAWQAGDSMSLNLFNLVDTTKLDLSGLTQVNFKVDGVADNFLSVSSGTNSQVFTYLQETGSFNVYFQEVPTGGALAVIPEPSSATLGLVALSGLLLRRRRKA